MNVVYVANEAYARHLGVSLCSLYDRNPKERHLRVFVVDTGITEQSREKLGSIARGFGREKELLFCPLRDLRERFAALLSGTAGEIDTGSFDISTMGRLFLGSLLPEDTEQVLYLDCDTVVLRPLGPLWRRGLGPAPGSRYVLAAVPEPTIYREVRRYLGLRPGEPYYNAGVLLIDLKRWREEHWEDKVLSCYAGIAEQSLYNDQDALNGCLQGRIRMLSPRWNFFTNYRYFRYETLCGMSPSYLYIPEEEFRRAKRCPAIVHFAGDERPWKAGSLNYYGRAYTRYLARTPWRGTPKEEGSRVKMLAYHGMDLATILCPPVRAAISRAYVKRVMAERAERRRLW